jgi:hypothetical protein
MQLLQIIYLVRQFDEDFLGKNKASIFNHNPIAKQDKM